MDFQRKFRQTATIWRREDYSSAGKPNFTSPELFLCRYAASKELIEENKGEERYSKAIVVTDQSFNEGDAIALGDHIGTPEPEDANADEIKRAAWVPDARDEYRLYIYHI